MLGGAQNQHLRYGQGPHDVAMTWLSFQPKSLGSPLASHQAHVRPYLLDTYRRCAGGDS